MKVEIWSDVVCPWCYIGKRRFEAALGRFAHGDDVEVVWRSFELDPGAPVERLGDQVERLARKYGMTREQAIASRDRITRLAAAEGLDFHLERSRGGNTFDAHRLLHLGTERGIGDAVKERLLAAYFVDGEPIGDRDTLIRLGVEAGLDADEAAAVLDGDAYATEVRADEQLASRLGATGVPFFVVDGRYAIPGAQDPEVIVGVLQRAWDESRPVTVAATGDACSDESCVV
jgi:predicted DsbA family dithiol-disulfide isomerase